LTLGWPETLGSVIVNDELLSIGRFARLCGLTIGALRHYDEVGLLRPASVNGSTGYRSYARGQLAEARAIARLRAVELSLDEIRTVLRDGDDAVLHAALGRTEARLWQLQRIRYRLQRLLERKDDLMADPTTTDVDHRQLGVDLFNHVWTLLELPSRTVEQDDEMIHAAHASRYHWSLAGEPRHLARGEWQVSRVYSVLGRAEPALHHARRCLAIVEAADDREDWDLPFAYEALARASLVAGDREAAAGYVAQARELGEQIADPEDRELLESDLAGLAAS
jgi:DNA-binding transcriptional MerR regulator